MKALAILLLLSGCTVFRPECFQFDTNRNCPFLDPQVL
jgi:hypothetical protein